MGRGHYYLTNKKNFCFSHRRLKIINNKNKIEIELY